MPASTNRVSRALAVLRSSASPETRNGNPHSSANTVPENCVVKWVHSPSRVPGCRQALARSAPTCASVGAAWRRGAPAGESRTTSSDEDRRRARWPRRRDRNAVVQPRRVQQGDQRDGAEDLAGLPDQAGELGHHGHAPRREPGGHQAQHADERHRVAGADQHAPGHGQRHGVGQGEHDLAGRHQHGAADDQAARAEAVEEQPDRHLQGGVDQQLEHGEARQHAGRGVEPVVSRRGPTTPRDVRCRTATTYAVTPTDQTSQARREEVIVAMVPDGRQRWVARGISASVEGWNNPAGEVRSAGVGEAARAARRPCAGRCRLRTLGAAAAAARDCGCDPAPTWAFVLVAAECLPLAVRRRWPFGAALAGRRDCPWATASPTCRTRRSSTRRWWPLHRRGARVAAQGQRRGRHRRGRPGQRGLLGQDRLRLPGPRGQRGGVRHRVAARRQRAQPSRPGRRAGGPRRTARTDPGRRGARPRSSPSATASPASCTTSSPTTSA